MTSSPFRIQDFWPVATPGSTLCLLDGTYRGASNVISPSSQGAPSDLSGTSTNPITIRALNDGKVLIDGEFARAPISLRGARWFNIEGINFRNGGGSVIYVAASSQDVNFRRVVAWDANMTRNVHVVLVTGSHRIRFFDAGFFGTGRKIWSPSESQASDVECHRCWIRWEGNTTGGSGPATMRYNSFGVKLIDSLITYDAISMPENYCVTNGSGECTGEMKSNFTVDNPFGVGAFMDSWVRSGSACSGARILGSLFYITANQFINQAAGASQLRLGPAGSSSTEGGEIECVHLRHTALIISPQNHTTRRALFLRTVNSAYNRDKIIRNITTVAGVSNYIEGPWDVAGIVHSTKIPSLNSPTHPWTQSGSAGANLCYRYGTTTPKWPFPMNERIRQATAMAGAYRGPCTQCSGTMPRQRTATNVTAEVEALLGPIPSQCRTH